MGYKNDRMSVRHKGRISSTHSKSRKRKGGRLSLKRLAGDIHTLQKDVKKPLSIHTYKAWDTGRLLCSSNVASYGAVGGISNADIATAQSAVRFYDPTGVGSLETNTMTAATPQTVFFKKAGSILTGRNNTAHSFHCRIYTCVPRAGVLASTDSTVTTAVASIADQMTDGSYNHPSIYPTEGLEFMRNWKIVDTVSATLQPGDEVQASYFHNKGFEYNHATFTPAEEVLTTRHGSHVYLIRVTGTLVHDNANAALVGTGKGQLDYSIQRKAVLEYANAGTQLNDIHADQATDAVTTATQGHQHGATTHDYDV